MPHFAVLSTFVFITSKEETMPDFSTYFINLGPHEAIGVAGFLCYIGAFGSVQVGLMDGNSMAYSLANIMAAALVAISLLAEFNLASALIQVFWIVISTIGILTRMRLSRARSRGQVAGPAELHAAE